MWHIKYLQKSLTMGAQKRIHFNIYFLFQLFHYLKDWGEFFCIKVPIINMCTNDNARKFQHLMNRKQILQTKFKEIKETSDEILLNTF